MVRLISPLQEKLPVSVVVLTFNEERHIEDCLRSVAAWAGEVHVVDSGSTDGTLDIVACYTEKIASHPFETYSRQRNWAQENLPLSCDWILHVDADERISPELAASIHRFFSTGQDRNFNGAMLARRTVFMGRWIRHGGHYPVFHMRLYRRDRGRCEDRNYHQHFIVPPPVTRLQGDLIDIVASELDMFSLRHIRWIGEEANELSGSRTDEPGQVPPKLMGDPIARRRWLRNNAYGKSPLFVRAFALFVYRYIVRLGFLDGTEGLIFHFLQGCWSPFLIDAKIWEAKRGARVRSAALEEESVP